MNIVANFLCVFSHSLIFCFTLVLAAYLFSSYIYFSLSANINERRKNKVTDGVERIKSQYYQYNDTTETTVMYLDSKES